MPLLRRLRAQDQDFFAALAGMAEHVSGTASALHAYLDDPATHPTPATHQRRLQLDALSEELDRLLIEAFIAPIDPEDLTELNAVLHALGDGIDDAARLFAVLHLEGRRGEAVELARLLLGATSQLEHAVQRLDDARVLAGANARIMESMRDADAVYDQAIASVLDGSDVLGTLKWKDVFDRLQNLVSTVGRAGKLLRRIAARSQT